MTERSPETPRSETHAPGFRYSRWPIRFGFARHTALHAFDRHGWPQRGGGYGQTIHIGPIKVYLGRMR